MSQTTLTFRNFVSSTFSDLEAEQIALQERVFPRLRDLAAAHRCHFQVIDLRWGVSDEASLDQQAMNICLGEIERCQMTSPRPNFLVLLGDRYGWCPPPSQIPEDEFTQILGVIAMEDKALMISPYRITPIDFSPALAYEAHISTQPADLLCQQFYNLPQSFIFLPPETRLAPGRQECC